MANSIKLELEQNKLRLEFYKARAGEMPVKIQEKWIEIYQERVKRLERQLSKTQSARAQKSA